MTDDDRALADMAERNREAAAGLLKHAHLFSPDPTEQAVALITAATVLIEREVGTGMASAALMALVEPSLRAWAVRAGELAQRPGEAMR